MAQKLPAHHAMLVSAPVLASRWPAASACATSVAGGRRGAGVKLGSPVIMTAVVVGRGAIEPVTSPSVGSAVVVVVVAMGGGACGASVVVVGSAHSAGTAVVRSPVELTCAPVTGSMRLKPHDVVAPVSAVRQVAVPCAAMRPCGWEAKAP